MEWLRTIYAQTGQQHMLLAEWVGEVVGFLGFVNDRTDAGLPARTAYIADMYVCPEARPIGVAGALFDAFVGQCVASGCTTIRTNTDTSNRRVRTLLMYLGFQRAHDISIPRLHGQVYFKKVLHERTGWFPKQRQRTHAAT
jgi:GNAT superfamily N-acetyltransferase